MIVQKLLTSIAEALSAHPYLLAISLPLCVLAAKSPEIIRAVAAARRDSKKAAVELTYRKKMLDMKLESEIDKRTKRKGG